MFYSEREIESTFAACGLYKFLFSVQVTVTLRRFYNFRFSLQFEAMWHHPQVH
jgi:hypothetical protein